jgi:hypothetical protein
LEEFKQRPGHLGPGMLKGGRLARHLESLHSSQTFPDIVGTDLESSQGLYILRAPLGSGVVTGWHAP